MSASSRRDRDRANLKILEYILVGGRRAASFLQVLPHTMFARSVENGTESYPRSVHRWWSPDFRARLYSDLETLLEAPTLPHGGPWTAEDLLKVAGIGLISESREEIGFGLDLMSALDRSEPDEVRMIIDGIPGLRYLEAFDCAAKASNGVPFRLFYMTGVPGRPGIRPVRVPRRLTGILVRAVSWLRARRRGMEARRLRGASRREPSSIDKDCPIAVFETTSKGWESSRPILMELRQRGENVLELTPQSGAVLLSGDGESTPVRLDADVADPLSLRSIMRAARELITGRGDLIATPRHKVVATEIISRRARAYLPGMAVAAALARLAVEEVGVNVTLQEDHTSPSGRAFLIESNRLGAHTVAAHHGIVDGAAPERRYFANPATILEWGDLIATFSSGSTRSRVVGSHLVEQRMDAVVTARHQPTQDPIVLVAFGRPGRIADPEFLASAIRMVAIASIDSPVPFVVNIHPGDRRVFWDIALSSVDQTRLQFSRDRIYELMERAVAVITSHSTVGAEAMLADIPVICIGSHRDPATNALREGSDIVGYVSAGAAYQVSSPTEITSLIVDLCSGADSNDLAEGRADFARRFLHRTDGRSSYLRTTDIILELTGRDG